jgi:hypothetical protein
MIHHLMCMPATVFFRTAQANVEELHQAVLFAFAR